MDDRKAIPDLSRGMRVVAMFEALKGALVLIAGFGLLSLLHRDLQDTAENIVRHIHLNPARHYPRVFIEAAAHVDDARLRMLAALAFLYSAVRLVEAYGLWRMQAWAEWFAILSGAVYLPIEAYKLFERPTWIKGMVLLVNAAIVAYLARVRLLRRGGNADHDSAQPERVVAPENA